jgi:hypothetical protein
VSQFVENLRLSCTPNATLFSLSILLRTAWTEPTDTVAFSHLGRGIGVFHGFDRILTGDGRKDPFSAVSCFFDNTRYLSSE